jgi:branched-chain amino acid transport system substrate-binding protein
MKPAFSRPSLWILAAVAMAFSTVVFAQKHYGPGVTDVEIKLGQTMPYSGPVSALGTIGRAQVAYFAKINAAGGINGRKVQVISLDDGYNPAKGVEQVRRLVEQDEVLLVFSAVGTPTNLATRKYLNTRKVPQLLTAGGDSAWGDYKHYPWTMGWMPTYRDEARLYARHILQNRPDAKIAVLYLNDDYGREYLQGLKDGLGDKAARMIVAEQSYEVSDPTVKSQVVELKASGADTFFSATVGKHATQAIVAVWELGWRPQYYAAVSATPKIAILQPAGLEKAVGMITAYYAKDPTISRWQNDPAVRDYWAWAKKYYAGDPTDGIATYGYQVAQVMEYILRKCGDDLTRENVMRVAASMQDVKFPLLVPGVSVNTTPTDYYPIDQFELLRFNGDSWDAISEVTRP